MTSEIARALAATVQCPQCGAGGLCLRCWVVARAADELIRADRRDQAADDLAGAA